MAMPLKAVQISFSDTNAAKEVHGARSSGAGSAAMSSSTSEPQACPNQRGPGRHFGPQVGDQRPRQAGRPCHRRIVPAAARRWSMGRETVLEFEAPGSEPPISRMAKPPSPRTGIRRNSGTSITPENQYQLISLSLIEGDSIRDTSYPRAIRLPRILDRRPRFLPERKPHLPLRRSRWTTPRSAPPRRLTRVRRRRCCG